MSVEEAINICEEAKTLALDEGSDAIVLLLNSIKRSLESEPEPTEFTTKIKEKSPIEYPWQIHLAEKNKEEFYIKLLTLIPDDLFERTRKIDRLIAEIKAQDEDCRKCPEAKKEEIDHLTAALKTKDTLINKLVEYTAQNLNPNDFMLLVKKALKELEGR